MLSRQRRNELPRAPKTSLGASLTLPRAPQTLPAAPNELPDAPSSAPEGAQTSLPDAPGSFPDLEKPMFSLRKTLISHFGVFPAPRPPRTAPTAPPAIILVHTEPPSPLPLASALGFP